MDMSALHTVDYLCLGVAALCVGMGKTGFSGLGLVAVFIMAELFGKASVGILLPMLVVADLTVFPAFRKHGTWAPVWRLLPPALLGMIGGGFFLEQIPEAWAKPVIGGLILLMVLLQGGRRLSPEKFYQVAKSRNFGQGAGIFAGVATMMANAAGPVFQLYFISQRVPKMELMGIGARFFLLVNLLKLPVMGGLSFTTWETLELNLKLIPLIWLGVFCGKTLLNFISQRVFEWMVVGFATLAGVRLIATAF